ncbi:hypothetical protein [Echinicola shivajiensis]|uniref:hypothetical protein n=1 Tax=Echinicola shivajiensis TaxID=1035916 RepID=UPI001BFCBA3B|nr:hypothetical protein [Echinicola shivajiensis]
MYNTKYQIQYSDINNSQTTINIKQKDYNGELIELEKFGVDPLYIKWYGEGESKFQTIQQSEATISLLSEFNFEFLEFADFEEKEYLVEIIKGGLVYWIGYLLPDNYSESYVAPPYEIQLLAIDWLTSLKDIDFTDSLGNNIYTTKSLLEILIIIFDKIGLDIPIYDGIDCKYDAGVTSALDETKINCKKFIDDLNGDNPTPWDCEKVLEEILTIFGATLKQNKGRWEITHFDNQSKVFQKFTYNGTYIASEAINQTKYLDDNQLKILGESGDLEIEGAKKSVEITQKIEGNEDIIVGGNFKQDASWNTSTDLLNWNENNIEVEQSEDGLYITSKFDNLHQGTGFEENTKDYYIKSNPIAVSRLPISSSPTSNDKWFDIDYKIKLRPEYFEPTGLTTDPNFDREQYYLYLETQLNDFINALDMGSFFAVKYVDSSGTYWLNFRYTLVGITNTPVARGRNYRSEWINQPTIIWNQYLDADRVEFNRLEPSTNRNIYDRILFPENIEFLNKTFNYDQRIYLYEEKYDQETPLIQDDGYFEFYFCVPWFTGAVINTSGVPVDYMVDFSGVGVYFEQINVSNENADKDPIIYTGDNGKNIKKLDDIEVETGDGEALYFGTLFKNDGITPTISWQKDSIELPILQHTANRIINQYQAPTTIFRADIFTSEILNLNDVIFNPITNKNYVIQGLELNDKEAEYSLELRELYKPINFHYYNLIRDGVGVDDIPLSNLETGISNTYDLGFAIIACLGHRDYFNISDNIIDILFNVQASDGSFTDYLEDGALAGNTSFRSNSALFYGLNYYIKNRYHNKNGLDKAKVIVSKMYGFIEGHYFKNGIGLGFDNNLINTKDNITYYFGLKLFDRDMAVKLKYKIDYQLFNGNTVYSGILSHSNNQLKENNQSLLLSAFAYLYSGNSSFIDGISSYYDEEVYTSLLLALCYFKNRNYDKWEDINETIIDTEEDDENFLLPTSIKLIINNVVKNNIF